MKGFLIHACSLPDKFLGTSQTPSVHSAALPEGSPGSVTELAKPLDNIPQLPGCIPRARPFGAQALAAGAEREKVK